MCSHFPTLQGTTWSDAKAKGMNTIYGDDLWIAIVIVLLVLILLAVTGHLKL
jgi:hypothetical protein